MLTTFLQTLSQRPGRFLAGLTLSSLLLGGAPALAQQRLTLTQLQQQLEALRQRLTTQETTNTAQQRTITNLQMALTRAQTTITALTNRLVVVEGNPVLDLGDYVSVELAPINSLPGPHILWARVNVHVRSGAGATDGAINGRGNLVVGYNEHSGTGSHNLVVGKGHTFTSFGGLVAGLGNSILAPYTSVTGGHLNRATSLTASVSGGDSNAAEGISAHVSGGFANLASGEGSSISGGQQNTSSGQNASVSGGGNTASDDGASVSGGNLNTASGFSSSVSGGSFHQVSGSFNWQAGALFQNR